MDLFKAEDIRNACGISQRQLDYWVERGYVHPTKISMTERRIFFFSFEEVVRIRLMKSLRDAGVSLQRIRTAISELRKRKGNDWQSAWVVTDGRKLFEVSEDGSSLRSLSKGERGQFAFSLIAIGSAWSEIQTAQDRGTISPVDINRFKNVEAWNEQQHA